MNSVAGEAYLIKIECRPILFPGNAAPSPYLSFEYFTSTLESWTQRSNLNHCTFSESCCKDNRWEVFCLFGVFLICMCY